MIYKQHIHLITVGYSTEHALVTLQKVKPDKIILLYMLDPHRPEDSQKVKKTVEKIKSILRDYMGIEAESYEIKDWDDIDQLFEKYENAVFSINLTGALKILALMLYIYALSNPSRVMGIYYARFHRNWALEELPKAIIPYSLTTLEREILTAKAEDLVTLEKELKKSKSLLVRYLNQLQKKGLVEYSRGKIKRKKVIVDPLF